MISVRAWLRLAPALVGAILAAASTLLVAIRVEPTLDLPAEVRAREYRVVRAPADGRVVRVHVEPGAHVGEGELLVTLENPAAERRLRTERRELREVRRQMALLEDRRRALTRFEAPDETDRALRELAVRRLEASVGATRVEQAEFDLEAARRGLERNRRLEAAGLLSDAALEEQEITVESLDRQVRQHRVEAEILEQRQAMEERAAERLGFRQESRLAALDAELQGLSDRRRLLESAVAELEASLASRRIHADLSGVVTGATRHELLGRFFQAGEDLMTILDPESIELTARVPEEALVRLHPGDPVRAEISGLPRQRYGLFDGRVGAVAPMPEVATGGGVHFSVVVALDRPWVDVDGERFYLRAGMAGRAEVAYRGRVSLGRRLVEVLLGE